MNLNHTCGGRFRRTDIVGSYDARYGRVMYSDTDPIKANWKCDKCGMLRTQRKRRPRSAATSKTPLLSPKNRPATFFYEIFDGEVRWWFNQEPGDVFDTFPVAELPHRLAAAKSLRIHTVDHLPGFCTEGDACPDHPGYH